MATEKRTKKEKLSILYDFLCSYITEKGYAPSYCEMGEALKLKSKANIRELLDALETEGKIKIGRDSNDTIESRAICLCGFKVMKGE